MPIACTSVTESLVCGASHDERGPAYAPRIVASVCAPGTVTAMPTELTDAERAELGTRHAHLYFGCAFAPPATTDEFEQIEASLGKHGHIKAIRLWQYGNELARAMFRVNEIGRVTLGQAKQHDREISRLTGLALEDSNFLGRAPFNLTQELPAGGSVDDYVTTLTAWADAFMFLLHARIEQQGCTPSEGQALRLNRDRPAAFPNSDLVIYEPLASALFTVGEALGDGGVPGSAFMDLAIGASTDQPTEGHLLHDGGLVITRWQSRLSKAGKLRAFEQKLRRRAAAGLLSAKDYQRFMSALTEDPLPDEIARVLPLHGTQSGLLDEFDKPRLFKSAPVALGEPQFAPSIGVYDPSKSATKQQRKVPRRDRPTPVAGTLVRYHPDRHFGTVAVDEQNYFVHNTKSETETWLVGDVIQFTPDSKPRQEGKDPRGLNPQRIAA